MKNTVMSVIVIRTFFVMKHSDFLVRINLITDY